MLEQATDVRQYITITLKHIVVDAGFRGVDADKSDKEIMHLGKFRSLSKQQYCFVLKLTVSTKQSDLGVAEVSQCGFNKSLDAHPE